MNDNPNLERISYLLTNNGNVGYQLFPDSPHIETVAKDDKSELAIVRIGVITPVAFIRDMEYDKSQQINIGEARVSLRLLYDMLLKNGNHGIEIPDHEYDNSVLFVKSNPDSHFAIINTVGMPRRIFIRVIKSDFKNGITVLS